jgi:hypothetical protein
MPKETCHRHVIILISRPGSSLSVGAVVECIGLFVVTSTVVDLVSGFEVVSKSVVISG